MSDSAILLIIFVVCSLPFVIFIVPVIFNLIYSFKQSTKKTLFNTKYKGKELFWGHITIYLWIVMIIILNYVLVYYKASCFRGYTSSFQIIDEISLKLGVGVIFDMCIFCLVPWIMLLLQKKLTVSIYMLLNRFIILITFFTAVCFLIHPVLIVTGRCLLFSSSDFGLFLQ